MDFPSPRRKRQRTRAGDSLRECGYETGGTNQRGDANARCNGSAKKDGGGRDEEDNLRPSLLTASAARISSRTAQEVVQEEATPDDYLRPGWTRTKLEPDC